MALGKGLGLGKMFMRGGGASYVFILDEISATPRTAYSTRKMVEAYAGYIATLRRISDNDETEVEFSNNRFLTSSNTTDGVYSTWAAATAIRFKTWYTQVGVLNATQATANAQLMQTFDFGSTIATADLGAPSIRFNTSGTIAQVLGNGATVGSYTIHFEVQIGTVPGVQMEIFRSTVQWLNMYLETSGKFTYRHFTGAGYISVTNDKIFVVGDKVIVTVVFNGSTLKIYCNGGTPNSIASGAIAAGSYGDAFNIGCTGVLSADVHIPEFITAASALSNADLNLLGSNEASFYGGSWTNV